MMEFKIDKQKAIKLAEQMGLNVSFNSSNPGVILKSESETKHKKFVDLFPELNTGYNGDKFITKDSGNLPTLSRNINIAFTGKAVQNIVVNNIEIHFVPNTQINIAKAS